MELEDCKDSFMHYEKKELKISIQHILIFIDFIFLLSLYIKFL